MFGVLGRGLRVVFVCGVAAVGALAWAPVASADSGCALVASPAGSDAAAGSEAAPLRSAQKLVDRLQPGQTGCLRAGTYEAARFGHGGITLRGFADERATLVGRLYVPRGSDGVTVQGLYLDGTNPTDLPSPTINARGTTFSDNDVTNNHTAICFSLGHDSWGRAIDTTIARNRIHDCGQLPATNFDHGIYVNAADYTTITANWIYDNADRGIQLYPDAQHTTITHNVIDSNGQGIIFSGSGNDASNDTTVRNNLITNSRIRNNVESYYSDGTPTGQRNTVLANCIGGGARDDGDGGIGTQTGFNLFDNLHQIPAYNNPTTNDYRLHPDTPCADLLPSPTNTPGPRTRAGEAPLPVTPPSAPQTTVPSPVHGPVPTPAPAATRPTQPGDAGSPAPVRRTPPAARAPEPAAPAQGDRPTARRVTRPAGRMVARARLLQRRSRRGAPTPPVTLRVRGRLVGAGPHRGHSVRVMVRVGRRWRVVGRARVSRTGRFELTRELRLPRGRTPVEVKASLRRYGSAALAVAR